MAFFLPFAADSRTLHPPPPPHVRSDTSGEPDGGILGFSAAASVKTSSRGLQT
jgi:hypothetical protein